MTSTIRSRTASGGRQPMGRGYWYLWTASAVSTTGDGAFNAALPLLAVTITRDARLVAVVTAAMFLPWMLLSLPAGALVDRYDRAALMWRAQLVQFVAVGVVTLLVLVRHADIVELGIAAFCLGSAEVVFSNSAQAILPQLVPASLISKANGTQFAVQTAGEQFFGPPLGSLLFAASAALPFGLDAVSFAGSAGLLAKLPRPAAPAGAQIISAQTISAQTIRAQTIGAQKVSAQKVSAQIGEGLRWLFGHRLLRVVAVMLGIGNFSYQMGQAVLVLFATQTLHFSARGYGLLMAAAAVGSVVGGLVNPAITRRIGLLASLLISMAVLGVLVGAIGFAPDAIVIAGLMALEGFATTMWNIVTVSLRQTVVPAELLGRVNSVYRMLGWGLMPVGALAGGFVAHAYGLRAPYIVAGVLTVGTLVAVTPALVRHRGLAE